MGKGSPPHEDVVEFLRGKYGPEGSTDCNLTKIYTSDWDEKYCKETSLKCDYVGNVEECNALVDVVYKEPWMESLGKIIGYLYEISQRNDNKEVWIIFTSEKLWKTASKRKKKHIKTEDKYIEYWIAWHRRLADMGREVVRPELAKRLKFFEYDFNRTDDKNRLKEL